MPALLEHSQFILNIWIIISHRQTEFAMFLRPPIKFQWVNVTLVLLDDIWQRLVTRSDPVKW